MRDCPNGDMFFLGARLRGNPPIPELGSSAAVRHSNLIKHKNTRFKNGMICNNEKAKKNKCYGKLRYQINNNYETKR